MKKITGIFLLLFIHLMPLEAVQADNALIEKLLMHAENPVLYMPIGPSGSGKSTLYKEIASLYPKVVSFSLDSLRLEWYNPFDYDAAWKASVADPIFHSRAKAVFANLVACSEAVYLDATNLNPARRGDYIKMAKECGYTVVGIVFSVNLETLIARQFTRDDKQIPEKDVRMQVDSCMPPQIGEGFDTAFFISN